jgi:hypothetical protein
MPLPLVTEISGFPARFIESLGTQHFYQEAVIPGSEATRVFELDYNVRITLQIAVGPETVISLSYGHLIADIDAVMTDDNLYDVIPLFDVIPQRAIRRQQLDMLRTLFDHIEIRAKPE